MSKRMSAANGFVYIDGLIWVFIQLYFIICHFIEIYSLFRFCICYVFIYLIFNSFIVSFILGYWYYYSSHFFMLWR